MNTTVQGTVAAEGRLMWLQEQLAEHGAVTIAGAAAALAVSEMTIRRDLTELEQRGEARRLRGGARAIGPLPFARRRATAGRAKATIAAKIAGLVPVSGVIAIDASSTLLRLRAALDRARDLSILTNGPDTFRALTEVPGVTALLTGGQLDPRTGSLVGPLACRSATQLVVDRFFLSAAAVDPAAGALETTLEEAEVKRALASVAGDVVLATDASKLGRRAPAVGIEWDRIDVLVTELDPGDERLDPYRHLAEVR